MTTREQITAYVMACKAIADSIKELGQVPSGTLYAVVMGKMSLQTFEGIIERLCDTGLIKRDSQHLLTWVG